MDTVGTEDQRLVKGGKTATKRRLALAGSHPSAVFELELVVRATLMEQFPTLHRGQVSRVDPSVGVLTLELPVRPKTEAGIRPAELEPTRFVNSYLAPDRPAQGVGNPRSRLTERDAGGCFRQSVTHAQPRARQQARE